MRIGLVRHFRVNCSSCNLMTSSEFIQWVHDYDNADVHIESANHTDTTWDICFSSDLPRASRTAEAICSCKVITSDLLREVPVAPVFNTSLKLPVDLWLFMGRISWIFFHHSQPESKTDTEKRIGDFINYILSREESNILLVTHGLLMRFIRKELLKKGFSGDKFVKAKNGTIYVMKRY